MARAEHYSGGFHREKKKIAEVATGDLKFHFELHIKVPPAGICSFFISFVLYDRESAEQRGANERESNERRPCCTHFARFC